MRRLFKVAIIALLVIALAVIAIMAVLLRPVYLLPPEGKAAIDAKMAEYQQLARETLREMRSRPPEDAQAFAALVAEMGPATEEEKQPSTIRRGCPPYNQELLTNAQPRLQNLVKWENRIRAFVDDGLVLRKPEGYWEDNLTDILRFMQVFHWNNELAVLSHQQGKQDEAVHRLMTGLRVAEGFYGTTFPHGGVATEDETGVAIVQLLPRLAPADLARLKTALQALPDPRERAIKIDIVALAETLNTAEHWLHNQDASNEDGTTQAREEYLFWQEDFEHWLAGYRAKKSGTSGAKPSRTLSDRFIERQWYILQSIRLRQVDKEREWFAAGGEGDCHVDDDVNSWHRVIVPPFQLVMLTAVARIGPSIKAWQRRQALIAAIDAELKRRAEGGASFEMPYDVARRIVVNAEYGCIVNSDPPKTPATN